MNRASSILLFSCLLCLTCISRSHTLVAQNVSLRVGLDVSVMGAIEKAFIGPAAGLEVTAGSRIGLDFEVSVGYGEGRTLTKLQPSVRYYFGNQVATGFFFGAQAKIMTLKEAEGQDFLADNLYAIGPTLGVKQSLGERLKFQMVVTPHLTVGGINEADVAGIGFNLGLAYRL